MLGCSRGARFPVLFNGGIFNVDSRIGEPEKRIWQETQFIAQNQRLVYWLMLKTDDFDLMDPVLNMYRVLLPIQKIRAKHFWGIEGSLSHEKSEYFKGFLNRIPDIKTVVNNGYSVFPPAETWTLEGNQGNMEFPQLYTPFPFETYTFGDKGLEVAKNTWLHNSKASAQKNYICWFQGAILTAHLGLTNEAKTFLLKKFLHTAYFDQKEKPLMRLPVFWDNEPFDHAPDMDQPGAAMVGLKDMLMQTPGNKTYLFPAWPKNWDVNFKLHAPNNTIVECELKGGKVIKLEVSPAARKADNLNMLK
jgi:hypothetical protein